MFMVTDLQVLIMRLFKELALPATICAKAYRRRATAVNISPLPLINNLPIAVAASSL